MAATFDAKMTGGDLDSGRAQSAVNTNTCSSTGMTVGGSANMLIGILIFGAGGTDPPTGPTMTWNGVSMTLQPNVVSDNGTDFAAVYMFSLANPDTGNQTLAAAWTGNRDAYMTCISFNGAGIQAADNTTATQTTTINVPTDADGATVACFGVDGSDPTVNQTEIFSTAPNSPGGGASYAMGGSTTNSHTFTGAGGGRQALAGVHLISSAAVLEQEGYRWRNDDGDEDGATWVANQDTSITRAADLNTRLRALINATGDPLSSRFKLQFREVGDANWLDIGSE